MNILAIVICILGIATISTTAADVGVGMKEEDDQDLFAIQCYTCTWHPVNQLCLTNPDEVISPNKTCLYPTPWCFIQRRENKGEGGGLHELTRGCAGTYEQYIDDNSIQIIYKSSCNTDYCNVGDGIFKSGSIRAMAKLSIWSTLSVFVCLVIK